MLKPCSAYQIGISTGFDARLLKVPREPYDKQRRINHENMLSILACGGEEIGDLVNGGNQSTMQTFNCRQA